MIVLDASVALKWVLPDEEGGDAAWELAVRHARGTGTIAVPDLMFYEAANVLAMTPRLSRQSSWDAWHDLSMMRLDVYAPTAQEMHRAMEISRTCRVSVYDAYYAALAEALDCKMVTADLKLARKLAKLRLRVEAV